MKFSLIAAVMALALGVTAQDVDEDFVLDFDELELSSRATVSGTNPGSIFQFGNAAACRQLFWQYGACGLSTYFQGKVDPNVPLVAVPGSVFSKYGNAQNNKLCAKIITMKRNGVTRQAVVADQNVGGDNSIDMCLDLWQAFGGKDGDGSILKGMTWSIANV